MWRVSIGPFFKFSLGHLSISYWAVCRILIGLFVEFLLGHLLNSYWAIGWVPIGPFVGFWLRPFVELLLGHLSGFLRALVMLLLVQNCFLDLDKTHIDILFWVIIIVFVIIISIIIELIKLFGVSEFKISRRCLSWCGHSVYSTCNLHKNICNKNRLKYGAQPD